MTNQGKFPIERRIRDIQNLFIILSLPGEVFNWTNSIKTKRKFSRGWIELFPGTIVCHYEAHLHQSLMFPLMSVTQCDRWPVGPSAHMECSINVLPPFLVLVTKLNQWCLIPQIALYFLLRWKKIYQHLSAIVFKKEYFKDVCYIFRSNG